MYTYHMLAGRKYSNYLFLCPPPSLNINFTSRGLFLMYWDCIIKVCMCTVQLALAAKLIYFQVCSTRKNRKSVNLCLQVQQLTYLISSNSYFLIIMSLHPDVIQRNLTNERLVKPPVRVSFQRTLENPRSSYIRVALYMS